MNVQDFINEVGDLARPTLFEVHFHNLGEDMHTMRHLTGRCDRTFDYVDNEVKLEFQIMENEDSFVQSRLALLSGRVTVIQFSRTGEVVREDHYNFTTFKAINRLDWDLTNSIKSWVICGTATMDDSNE